MSEWVNSSGYLCVCVGGKIIHMHREIAERALGKPLPKGSVVHHVDGNKVNNSPENLIILQNKHEHMVLHAKLKVIQAGGDWKTQKVCYICKGLKAHGDFATMNKSWDGLQYYCKDCRRELDRKRWKEQKS